MTNAEETTHLCQRIFVPDNLHFGGCASSEMACRSSFALSLL
jgi:hypothetical protein